MKSRSHVSTLALLATVGIASSALHGQATADPKAAVMASIDHRGQHWAELAMSIWNYAELGYRETKSSAALQAALAKAGFSVEKGVAGMPTAFVANAGSGKPVIAFLAEYDALPGLSQQAVPGRRPVTPGGAGHACGHHLFGTAAVAAAVAVREWLVASKTSGTVRVYGTPAEEGGAGKVYMVREKLFEGVDVVFHWHPSDRNDASPMTSLANRSAKFRFYGVSSHAAGSPHRGRSALDGVEAMNCMVNLMREHVPEKTRIHYVITAGGNAPNVVPNFAEVYYYVRHPDAAEMMRIWERVLKAAEGAALGTGTTVRHEVIHGVHSLLPNNSLQDLVEANLRRVGGVVYDAADLTFAKRIARSLGRPELTLGSEREIQPSRLRVTGGSTDVGDVSWVVPTAGMNAATWVPGTSAHSWQAVAAGGTPIGTKGMLVAAKTLAISALDLYQSKSRIAAARSEFDRRRGADFVYRSLVGDRQPPLDYRDKPR